MTRHVDENGILTVDGANAMFAAMDEARTNREWLVAERQHTAAHDDNDMGECPRCGGDCPVGGGCPISACARFHEWAAAQPQDGD